MMKRKITGVVALLLAAVAAFASRKDEMTLIMVPREDNVVRVGLDIASRYPTLLISYKVETNGALSFHGWTGKEWVKVLPESFRSGSFFRTGPDSALIVEKEGRPVPTSAIPPAEWCEAVYKISTTDIRPLLHLTGQYYDFKYKEWEWFSKNYKLSIEAINPEGLNVAWYHKRLTEHIGGSDAVGADDLQYWIALRHPQPPVEPVVEEETIIEDDAAAETNEVDVVEEPEMEMPEDPAVMGNLLTNEVPEAAVIEGGTVDIEDAEETAETEEAIPDAKK